MIKQKIFVGRQCQNFVDSHQRRPGKTPFFVTKLKTFESVSTFDTSCGKYFGPRPLPSWCLRQWCNTATGCVSFIRCRLFISEVFIWNNYLKVFPRFCVAKQKPAYSYSCTSLFISIIWLPQGDFRATADGTAWLNKNQSLVPPKWYPLRNHEQCLLFHRKKFRSYFPTFLHFPESKG